MCFAFVSDEYKFVSKIDVTADLITTDNLGNLYRIEGDMVEKFLPSGDLQYKYSDLALGNVTALDASNSLRLTLYYKDLSQIVILDNTLSRQVEPISLDELGFAQVTVVCTSHDNSLWLYDQSSFTLSRVNYLMEPIQIVPNLNQVIDADLDPNFMVEYNNWLYMNDPEKGILVFDNFGTYSKTIPIKGLNAFQVFDKGLFYVQDDKLMTYNFLSLMETELKLPEKSFTNVQVQKHRLFIQHADHVNVYAH